MARNSSVWFLYIIETRLGHWYTGITKDVEQRFLAHQAGKGAKNLKGKGPLTLVHHQSVGTHSEAARLEYHFKRLTKAKKRQLVTTQTILSLLDTDAIK